MKGKKHGKGKYIYKTGDIYEGRFENDQKSDTLCNINFSTSKKQNKAQAKVSSLPDGNP